MNCQQAQAELSAYIDNELTPQVRAEVEAHIQACPLCQKRVAELNKLAEGVAALGEMQPASQFLAAVRRKIALAGAPGQGNWADLLFRPVWLKVPLEVVALAAILVVATVLINPQGRNAAQPSLAMSRDQPMPAESEPVRKPVSEKRFGPRQFRRVGKDEGTNRGHRCSFRRGEDDYTPGGNRTRPWR
jgi:hypothetical protein